jgi:hypothetical protein
MWGSDFIVGLAANVRVMSSTSIRVLPLGTYIIFFLLPMTLLVCQVILLNDVGTSSLGLTFGLVGLLADTMGDNPFFSSCLPVLPPELLLVDCCCFLSFANIGFSSYVFRLKLSFEWHFASHDKPVLVLCGQLELGKLKPPDSQIGMSGLAVPEFLLHSTNSLDRSGLL